MIRRGKFVVKHGGGMVELEAIVDTAAARLWVNPLAHYTECPWHEATASSPRPDEVPEATWAWARAAVDQGDAPTNWEVGELVYVVVSLAPRAAESAWLTMIDPPSAFDRQFIARSLDGRTQYEGWISTFHYSGPSDATLCGRHQAQRTETMLYVYVKKSAF